MAAICKMLSLAKLRLCFPKSQFWQTDIEQETANDYVGCFLSEAIINSNQRSRHLIEFYFFVVCSDEVYLPVVQATDVLEILNLILRIMCEAWLDHIYAQKTKFR